MFGVVVYLKDFKVRRERRPICSIWIAIVMMDYGWTHRFGSCRAGASPAPGEDGAPPRPPGRSRGP